MLQSTSSLVSEEVRSGRRELERSFAPRALYLDTSWSKVTEHPEDPKECSPCNAGKHVMLSDSPFSKVVAKAANHCLRLFRELSAWGNDGNSLGHINESLPFHLLSELIDRRTPEPSAPERRVDPPGGKGSLLRSRPGDQSDGTIRLHVDEHVHVYRRAVLFPMSE